MFRDLPLTLPAYLPACRFVYLSSRARLLISGLPDFSWHNIPKRGSVYQNESQIIPNCIKIYQIVLKYMYQVALKYTNIFHSKAFQNIPKLVFLYWKYTIWQPWSTYGVQNRPKIVTLTPVEIWLFRGANLTGLAGTLVFCKCSLNRKWPCIVKISLTSADCALRLFHRNLH
jgi:hypothetical protein